MELEYFFSPEQPDKLFRATAEVLSIFQIHLLPFGVSGEERPQHLSEGACLIEHHLRRKSESSSLETTVFYSDRQGQARAITELSEIKGQQAEGEIVRLAKVHVWRLMHNLTGATPSPWGILRGVRPTKLAHRLLDQGYSRQMVQAALTEDYLLTPAKSQLITDIALYQRKWLTYHPKQVSVYIGIPFCPTRCLYCSFPAYALPGKEQTMLFGDSLRQDLLAAADLIKQQGYTVQTVYIGGGTPTSLNGDDFAELLELTAKHLVSRATSEFTVEAGRPDSLDDRKIALMKEYRVGRVSINPQSMQQKTLKRIGRNHSVEDIINTFGKIRNYNFAAINMDVIAGLPGETVNDFQNTMEQILALDPENVTVHTLAVKKGSLLKEKIADVQLPDDQTVKHMVSLSQELLTQAGFIPYYLYRQKYMTGQMENIGYSKPGFECLYNIQIMEERQSIIGIGPHSSTKRVDDSLHLSSVFMPKDLHTYMKSIKDYIGKRAALFGPEQNIGGTYASNRPTGD